MKKIELNEISVLAVLENFYNDCFDEQFGTFDYELFGEEVFHYLRKLGLKKFNLK